MSALNRQYFGKIHAKLAHSDCTVFGAVTDDGVVDLNAPLGGWFDYLRGVLETVAMDEPRAFYNSTSDAIDDTSFLSPIKPTEATLAAGRNHGILVAYMCTEFVHYPSITIRRSSVHYRCVRPAEG